MSKAIAYMDSENEPTTVEQVARNIVGFISFTCRAKRVYEKVVHRIYGCTFADPRAECHKQSGICSVCKQCRNHCPGHMQMRIAPVFEGSNG